MTLNDFLRLPSEERWRVANVRTVLKPLEIVSALFANVGTCDGCSLSCANVAKLLRTNGYLAYDQADRQIDTLETPNPEP